MQIFVRFGKSYHPTGVHLPDFTSNDIGKTFRASIVLYGGLFQSDSVSRELRIEAVNEKKDALYTVIHGF